MKANNIAPNAASIKPAPAARALQPEHRESAPANKKCKTKDFQEDMSAADDDEDFSNIKQDPANMPEKFIVKSEGEESAKTHGPDLNFAEDLLQYYPQAAPTSDAGLVYEYNNGEGALTPTATTAYGYETTLKSENYDTNGAGYGFASPGYATPGGYQTPGYQTPMNASFGLQDEEDNNWDGNRWNGGSNGEM